MYLIVLSLDWMNYPGLELWKFVNLGSSYCWNLHPEEAAQRSSACATRNDHCRNLRKRKLDGEAALQRLQEAEGLLAHVDDEVKAVREAGKAVKPNRNGNAWHSTAQNEIEKLKQQGATSKSRWPTRLHERQLSEFLAYRSVELAGKAFGNECGLKMTHG